MLDIDFEGEKRFLVIEPNTKASEAVINMATEFMMSKLSDTVMVVAHLPITMAEAQILGKAGLLEITTDKGWYPISMRGAQGTGLLAEWVDKLNNGEVIEHVF